MTSGRKRMDWDLVRLYFPQRFAAPVLMSELDQHPTPTFVVWAHAFSSAEPAIIEALGDRLCILCAASRDALHAGRAQGGGGGLDHRSPFQVKCR